LGNALRTVGRFDEAEAAIRRAIAIRGDVAEMHVNLGNVLREKGDLPGAIAATRQAIRLRPDLADAHQTLGSHLLLAGEYVEGWREYEWRLRCPNVGHLRSVPGRGRWDGSELGGRTILLQSDAGLGDAIQCARFIPMVVDRGGEVVVECQKELVRLLGKVRGVSQVVSRNDPLPAFDVHFPFLSLPMAFNTTLQTIPKGVPYLGAGEEVMRKWAEKLSGDAGLRVGLVWAGNRNNTQDRKRTLTLHSFAPLADVGGIIFHSLQVGEAANQILDPPKGMKIVDHSAELTDLAETAGLAANLDLVISIDTAVGHLAGAIGKSVWMLLPFTPDWRWMLGREDSPWYPTMRLFRQEKFGDWDGAIGRVAHALGESASQATRLKSVVKRGLRP
jgi:hypothetical protein